MAEDTEVEAQPHSNGVSNGDHAPPTESPSSTTLPEPSVTIGNGKLSKAEKQKQKKQKQKQSKQLRRQQQDEPRVTGLAPASAPADEEQIEIEYVSAPLDLESMSFGGDSGAVPEEEEEEERFGGMGLGASGGLGFPTAQTASSSAEDAADAMEQFRKVFGKFASAEEVTGAFVREDSDDEDETGTRQDRLKATHSDAGEDGDEDEEDGGKGKMSKKQRKLVTRLKIADLKQVCERPDVVEVWDVTAPDPQLLVFLKAYRNTVPVPRHWSQKRAYLQGKRGIEKPAFKLPDYIEATGIGQMRQAYLEKEDAKKMKQKQRDRMQPKMGKMSIDYQVLHDAFFKYSSKPPLSCMGDIYYEGKEFESKQTTCKPGMFSADMRKALGMGDSAPPPWLINMQRYGPPPSYPNLKIQGLNAPIPQGSTFGYHAGGWGKPPVDESGVPVYGDVFDTVGPEIDSDDDIPRTIHWGELEVADEESEAEDDDEDDDDEDADGVADGIASGITSGMASGLVSGLASGIASSLPSGIETPEVFNLRKGAEPTLYTVLEQKSTNVGQNSLMDGDHVYVMPGQEGKGGARKRADGKADGEVTLTMDELEGLDEAGVKALYEQRVAAAAGRGTNTQEDFSDMVAAKAAQQKRKLAGKTQDGGAKGAKKSKADSFKF